MDYKDILDKKQKMIDDANAALYSETDKIEKALASDIDDFIDTFSTSKGSFTTKNKTENNKLLMKINDFIEKVLVRLGIKQQLKKFTSVFDDVKNESIRAIQNLNKTKTKIDTKNEDQLYIDDLFDNVLSPSNILVNITNKIRRILYKGITLGGKITDIKNAIKSLLKGDGTGIFTTYVKTYVDDAIREYDGAISDAIVQGDNDFNAYRYVGSLIKNSRPQCVRWINKYDGILSLDILQSECDWAAKYGTGYSNILPSPTITTFASVRGGHNCRHDALPYIIKK